jgi:hypothetical protein
MSTTTQWRVPPWAWLPLGCAIVAEAVSNALRAYGLGTHLEKFTVHYQGWDVSIAGTVLVLAAIAVTLSQARAAWVALTPVAPARQRIVSGFAALLLLAVSVAAMASHLLEAQRAKVADEGGQRTGYDVTLAAYEKAKVELDTLAGVRTIEAVKAALDAAPVTRTVFRRTAECTDVTRDDSFKDCRPVLDLRQEMAKAIRKRELEPEVARLGTELAGMTRPETVAETEQAVAGFWAWIMGLGVVFIATLGSVIFAKVETVTPVAKAADTPVKVADTPGQTDFDAVKEAVLGPQPVPPSPKKRKRKTKHENARAWLKAEAEKNGGVPNFRLVRSRFHLSNGSASRIRKEVMAELGVAA